MTDLLNTLWMLTLEMAPYLLFGFTVAGVLHAFVPQTFYRRHLSRPGFGSVLTATMIGVPLPLCSCGVIPTTVALRRAGASRGACTSFLIATPQTGVDSILATYSLLGLPFAIIRPVAALTTGLVGGWLTDITSRGEGASVVPQVSEAASVAQEPSGHVALGTRIKSMLAYGFGELMEDVGRWLIVGLVVAALITELVPDNFFVSLQAYPIVNMLLVLVVAIPMYLCATGSIPIALSLMAKGLTPGAALVMLMAGPAVNAASLLVVGKALGRKQMYTYIGSIVGGAMSFGLLVDYALPAEWFAVTSHASHACCHADEVVTPWYTVAVSVVFVLLLVRAVVMRYMGHKTCHCSDSTYHVKGMRCNHCAANCRQAVEAVDGVERVEVDLPSGRVTVHGHCDDAEVRAAIEKAGYSVE